VSRFALGGCRQAPRVCLDEQTGKAHLGEPGERSFRTGHNVRAFEAAKVFGRLWRLRTRSMPALVPQVALHSESLSRADKSTLYHHRELQHGEWEQTVGASLAPVKRRQLLGRRELRST
jgi:hypothetical protein